MSEPPKAVFLSYAREDADAARHISDAFRGFGVEVWFDMSELRGGDQWDQKIRGQIKACGLFIPVVSQTTQARDEAYFRLEWKLADDRSQLMAPGKAFIVPVVIDDTPENGAAVPDSFGRAQWIRLPGGEPTPEFVAQVKRLLDGPKKPALKTDNPKPATSPDFAASSSKSPIAGVGDPGPASTRPATTRRFPIWLPLVSILIAGTAVVFIARKPQPAPAIAPPPAAPAPSSLLPAPSSPPQADSKSIAVLPFDNMSDDKENAYFADGIHEDILTNLAKLGDLKVIARTSVMEYRVKTKKIQQIAQELGVAYVLEGSVRRSGNKVRVVCQLIDGRTGQHVLAPDPYDRDLADIFAIQSEVAKSIAEKLRGVLSPGEKAALERPPTDSLVAYDVVLKARELGAQEANRRTRVSQTQPLYQKALELDPKFALAWVGLANTYLETYNYLDHTAPVAAQAKAAIDRALVLAPDNGLVVGTLANYYIDMRDLPRATEVVDRLKRDFPNQSLTLHVRARLANRQGQRAEAQACYREAVKLDPRNDGAWFSLQSSFWTNRKYDEALACARKILELVPDNPIRAYTRALITFDATGSTTEMEKVLASLAPEIERADPAAILIAGAWARIRGDADGVIRYRRDGGNAGATLDTAGMRAPAEAYLAKGQADRARPILEQECVRLQGILEREPDNADNWGLLAYARAMLGDRAGALAAREKAKADPVVSRSFSDAYFHAWLGDKDEALSALVRQVENGTGSLVGTISTNRLRHGLYLWPLVGDPRFEAILNDPKNNQPLF